MRPTFWLVMMVCASAGMARPATTQPVAVLARSGLFVVENGAKRRLVGADHVETISSVALGNQIVATHGKRIFLIETVEGKKTPILEHSRPVRFPEVSPDGNLIAFSSEGENGWEVWLANIDGSNPRKVLDAFAYGPSFSADGKYLYHETTQGICRVELATRNVDCIVASSRAHTVRCSRDGKHIAYSAAGMLYLGDATRQSIELKEQPNPAGRYDRFPSFSSDGKFIAFYRQTSQDSTLNRPGEKASHLPQIDQIVVRSIEDETEETLEFTDAELVCFLRPR